MESEEESQSMFYQIQEIGFPFEGAMEEQIPDSGEKMDYVQHFKHIQEKQDEAQLFQQWGVITHQQKSSFNKFKQHNKYITGIRGIVTLNEKEKQPHVPMSEYNLNDFFDQEGVICRQIFEKGLTSLSKMFQKVDNNLVGNFQNFTYIEKANEHQFLANWKINYLEKLKILSQKKTAINIFQDLFNWWLQGFHSMMLEIQKCSPLYTLNLFKKQKDNPNFCTDEVILKDKDAQQEPKQRRLWTTAQIQILNKALDNNISVPTQKIQQIANQLSRSVLAVQSKIQKIQKQRKDKPLNNLSLQKKMLIILSNNPNGLTKQDLLLKMQSQLEMGQDETWKKSVTQILSVCKKVSKTKGTFSFTQNPKLQAPTNFKNKVIACLYDLPNQKGNLKAITRKYIQKFFGSDGLNPQDVQRVKITQDNIYKTIFKNDIFDKSNSKQIYRYVENDNSNKDSQSDRSQSSSKNSVF